MVTNAQIQLHFPSPGDWGQFLLTALWRDAEGYECRRDYDPATLPPEHLPTLQQLVAGIVALDAPWQATHVIASLHRPEEEAASATEESTTEAATAASAASAASVVRLVLAARRADGACRHFTHADYPQLQLTDTAVLRAFRELAGSGG